MSLQEQMAKVLAARLGQAQVNQPETQVNQEQPQVSQERPAEPNTPATAPALPTEEEKKLLKVKCRTCHKKLYYSRSGKLVKHYHDSNYSEVRHSTAVAIVEMMPDEIPEWISPAGRISLPVNWNGFKAFCEVAEKFQEEIFLDFTPEGIKYIQMDPSHVVLAEMLFSAQDCSTYNFNKEKFQITLRAKDVVKGLKRFKTKELLSLTIQDGNVTFKTDSGEFSVNQIVNYYKSEVPTPKLQFNTSFTVDHAVLLEKLAKVKEFSDHVQISASRADGIVLYGRNDDGSATEKLVRGEPYLSEEDIKTDSYAMYSLEWIMPVMRATKCCDKVKVEYSSKLPIKISMNLADYSTFNFYLAPRITES